jgi:type VI secretion system protein VasD
MAGCGKIPGLKPPAAAPPPPPPPLIKPARPLPINLTFQASATVNPSESGRPSPVVVRLYQLKNDAAFMAASYDRLYEDDEAVLKPDLVEKTGVTLRPGDKTTMSLNFGDDVRFIGIAAFYRNYDNTQWRIPIPMPLKGDGTVVVDRASVSFVLK